MKPGALPKLLLAAAIQFPLYAMAAPTLIDNVRVFDGQSMLAPRSVLIDGAMIVDPDFKGTVPAGVTVVKGAGRTLLPGLIDAHVHAFKDLALPLMFGVTTQVDMFTGVSVMQEMHSRMKAGKNADMADLFSAGTLATAPGGHGTQMGLTIPTLTSPEQAQAFVDARVAEGSDFIKIVMEDGFAGMHMPTLDRATVAALVKAAHARSKLAVVHVSSMANARTALEVGADGLVHLFAGKTVDQGALDALVTLAASRHAFVIPTFSLLESVAGMAEDDVLNDARMNAMLDSGQREPLRSTYGRAPAPAILAVPKALTLALQRAGVTILAGTDAGNAGTQYGASLHHELNALVQAGLTPVQALAAATSGPARVFGLGQRGRILKGYKADLLLVDGDPGADINATRRIVTVWKDGQDASQLRERQREHVAQDMVKDKAKDGAPKAQTALALPADGRISLFTRERLNSPVGFGWIPSTDGIMGGKSTVQLDLQDPEAGEQPALAVSATVSPGFMAPWAGVAFMPGKQPMQPADLSGAKVIRFKVRGDGQQYRLNVLWKGTMLPASAAFSAGSAWREVAIPFSSFKGMDASMITMIAFNAGPAPGNYAFQIADVRLLNQ